MLAACLAAGEGSAGSHASAAWVWELRPRPPALAEVTVLRPKHPRLQGVVVHRSRELPLAEVVRRKGLPVTDVTRTLIDLAATVSLREIDDLVDAAIGRRLVTPDHLRNATASTGRASRWGTASLRASMARLGYFVAPESSVLEARVHRLLVEWGIVPVGVEVVVLEGRYRVDVLLPGKVILEIDGYTFHSSPKAKASDSRRQNALVAAGYRVLRSDWITVMHHPEQLERQLRDALAPSRSALRGPPERSAVRSGR